MSDIDPVQFGKLIEKLDTTSAALEKATAHIDALNVRISTLEERYKLGKVGIVGLATGLGFAIFGIKETLEALWKAWL